MLDTVQVDPPCVEGLLEGQVVGVSISMLPRRDRAGTGRARASAVAVEKSKRREIIDDCKKVTDGPNVPCHVGLVYHHANGLGVHAKARLEAADVTWFQQATEIVLDVLCHRLDHAAPKWGITAEPQLNEVVDRADRGQPPHKEHEAKFLRCALAVVEGDHTWEATAVHDALQVRARTKSVVGSAVLRHVCKAPYSGLLDDTGDGALHFT